MFDPLNDPSHAHFPLWLELSGLPDLLNEKAKGGHAWLVFRKIVELDLAANPVRPGTLEVKPAEIARRCGLEPKRVPSAVKLMRKAGVLRAFLPDHEEEPALFQIITPIPTPQSCDEVRAKFPEYFFEGDWPPRYSQPIADEAEDDPEKEGSKTKAVVELYFNVFSMKMNSIILDQLRLIAHRYELELIRKVFAAAKKKDAQSLAWILAEIRREDKVRVEAERLRKETEQ